MRVEAAHVADIEARIGREALEGIRAQQRDAARGGVVVPERLEFHCRVAVPLAPQHVHGFTARAQGNLVTLTSQIRNHGVGRGRKTRAVEPPADSNRRQQLVCVDETQAARPRQVIGRHAIASEPFDELLPVVVGDDDDGGLACGETVTDEFGEMLDQGRVAVVELDGMIVSAAVRRLGSPERTHVSTRYHRCKRSQTALYLLLMSFLLRLVANTLAILIVAWMLDGIHVVDAVTGVIAGLVLALVNAIVKPILVILTLPLTLLTLGLFYFVVNAICLALVAAIVPGFAVDGMFTTIFGALLISLFAWIINGVLGTSEQR